MSGVCNLRGLNHTDHLRLGGDKDELDVLALETKVTYEDKNRALEDHKTIIQVGG